MVQSYISVQKDVQTYLKKARADQAWLTEYSIRRNYTSPFRYY